MSRRYVFILDPATALPSEREEEVWFLEMRKRLSAHLDLPLEDVSIIQGFVRVDVLEVDE